MPPLAERRRRELTVKLQTLKRELGDWQTSTSQPPFRRHFSQVARIKTMLDGLLESMEKSSEWQNPTDAIVLTRAAEWERRILTAHAIWEVFRSKLAQRFDTHFQMRLAACDDLAWACYEPAMKKLSTATREPPLLYLNSTWSAFLRRRDVAFDKDVEAGKDARELLDETDYRTTLKKLPVPLLGLPWFQVAHLPSALLIAHEIGHAVEFDFDLTAKIASALRAAGLQHEADWLGCASEVFADLYGVLCLGSYFAGSLLDLLAGDPAFIAGEDAFGVYPTRAYRVELAVYALTALGQDADAQAVRTAWESQYGAMQRLVDYRDDAKKVVDSIYGSNGMHLTAVITPPAGNIPAVAQQAAGNQTVKLADQSDPRVLFAALRYAYENETENRAAQAATLIVQQVVNKNAGVFRFRGTEVAKQSDVQQQLAAIEKDDLAMGRDLARLLRLERDQADAGGGS